MVIASIEDLRRHLQWAIEIEHSTLPPYLCALYSLQAGSNNEPAAVIRSVFVEEMLHMVLAANLLNAVGGTPSLDRPDFIASYPTYLPHSARDFMVPLARFAPATIETFLRIERPEAAQAPPEDDRYHTIGQFYEAIERGFTNLVERLGEDAVFSGDRSRQVTPDNFWYGGSGRIVAITDLASALQAIDEIEEQGEGLKHHEVWDGYRDMFHPDADAVAHYFRFNEILLGQSYRQGDTPQSGPTGAPFEVDWTAVHPMRDNPRLADVPPDSPAYASMLAFNTAYCELLRELERALTGDPARLSVAVDMMFTLKGLAEALVQIPTGDGVTTAGPSFEYVPAP